MKKYIPSFMLGAVVSFCLMAILIIATYETPYKQVSKFIDPVIDSLYMENAIIDSRPVTQDGVDRQVGNMKTIFLLNQIKIKALIDK